MRNVKIFLLAAPVIAASLILGTPQKSCAQRIKVLAGNTLNGAVNGALLGGATMALKNDDDFQPARIGLGVGTLYGIGVGVYDLSQIKKGQQFYKAGTFNDGTNSTVLVLLDTIYGAAGGILIGSSVALIANKSFGDALQYGSGTGAWIGFGFGLVDSFVLAEGPNFPDGKSASRHQSKSTASGFLTYQSSNNQVKVGMLSPQLVQLQKWSGHRMQTTVHAALNVLQLNIAL